MQALPQFRFDRVHTQPEWQLGIKRALTAVVVALSVQPTVQDVRHLKAFVVVFKPWRNQVVRVLPKVVGQGLQLITIRLELLLECLFDCLFVAAVVVVAIQLLPSVLYFEAPAEDKTLTLSMSVSPR